MSPLRLLWLIFALCAALPAHASLRLAGQGQAELAGHLELLQGGARGADIDAVAGGRAGAFVPLPGHFVAGFGPHQEAWLRFSVSAAAGAAGEWQLRVLPPYLDQIDLYEHGPEGWLRRSGGDALPFSTRAINDRAMVFPITLSADSPRTFYLHLRHDGAFSAYLTLYTPEARSALLVREGGLFGLYFGVVAVLLAVNLLHLVTLREWLFAEFSLYLALRGVYFLAYDGLLFQYLLPEHPVLVHDLLQLLVTLVVASIGLVLIRVFDMPRLYPRLARLCWVLAAGAALISLSVFTGHFPRLGNLLSLIVLLLNLAGLFAALSHLRQRKPLGGLLLATMLLQVVGLALAALAGVGVHTGMFADLYGGQVASVAVYISLHFAVAVRVMEMKQAQSASERAARQAAELAEYERKARREQSDFVAMLFHEIKTPLAEIETAASVLELLDDGSRRDTARRYDTIHGAVERLNLLVERSLARERQGLEEVHLVRRPVDLAELARAVLESFRAAGSHTLVLEAQGPLPTVDGDPEFLRVAVANLIDNAIKYAPAGGEIRVEVRAAAGQVTLTVGDEGIGMDQETIARAFDRFWRGRGVGGGGAGLGLYLVRRILDAHGGAVRAESAPGRGSRLTLALPQGAA